MLKQQASPSVHVKLGSVTLLVAIALILLPAAVAHADEFRVDMTADDAGATACTSAANDCSLRGAVTAANTNPGADTIILPDRVFDLTLKGVLPPEDANQSGDLDISASGGSLRIVGEGAGATIIRGGSWGGIESGIDRVFHIDPAAAGGIRVEISGVSVQYGYATGYGGGVLIEGDNRVELVDSSVISNTVLVVGTPGGGGGIFNNEGTLVLENTDVMTNTARGIAVDSDVAGGGILVEFTGVLTLTGSTVAGNEASALQLTDSSIRGGGLANLHGQVYVHDSTVHNNRASAGMAGSLGLGGGIANADSGRLTIDQESVISDNEADRYGGGIANSGSLVAIESSTFSGNKATGGADGSASKGGGIYNKAGTVQIISSTLESNESVTLETPDHFGTGGGIANSGGTVELTSSSVRSNVADNDCGGIQNENGSTLTMGGELSALSQNEAGAAGGGLCNLASSVYMTDTTVTLNTAETYGGGIQGFEDSIFLTRCMVSGNKAYDGNGGGIFDAVGTLHVVDSMVFSNYADESGGGLYALLNTTQITGTTFSGNAAADLPTGGTHDNHGGAMYLYSGATHAVNSTISGNRADESGGGVFGNGATLSLSFTTIANNVADDDSDGQGDGGGIFEGVENPRIVNTVLSGNVDKGGEANNCGGPGVKTYGGNIIHGRGCTIAENHGTNWSSDPLLGPLADNGGPTDTHALSAGSPAIDRVTNDCRTYQALVLVEDQRGVVRPIGAACDIGAYEAAIVYLPLVVRSW
jgi:hypothetical protein